MKEKKLPHQKIKEVKFDIKPIIEIDVPQFDEIKEKISQIKLGPGMMTPGEIPEMTLGEGLGYSTKNIQEKEEYPEIHYKPFDIADPPMLSNSIKDSFIGGGSSLIDNFGPLISPIAYD